MLREFGPTKGNGGGECCFKQAKLFCDVLADEVVNSYSMKWRHVGNPYLSNA
jgi:hypothetical protein